MRSVLAGLRTLVLPWGATSTQPRIVIGVSPVPPELVTYYAGLTDPGTLVAQTLTIAYDGTAAGSYRYEALFTDNGTPPHQQVWYVAGVRGATGVVGETARWLINAGGALGNPDIVFSPSIGFLAKGLIQSQVNATNAQAYEVEINGELGVRLTINGDGSLHWSDGTNAADATLYRNAAGVFGADTIKANVSGVGETWHNVAGGVGFTSPWTDFGGGFQGARYRLMPDGTVMLSGLIKTTAAVTSPSPIFTLPAGYRPLSNEDFGSNVAGTRLVVLSTGVVNLVDFSGSINVGVLGLSGVRFALAGLT